MALICQETAKLLAEVTYKNKQKTPLNECESKEKALEIERRLRLKDDEMGVEYKSAAVAILNKLKGTKTLIKGSELENLIATMI